MEKFHKMIITSLTNVLQDGIMPLASFYGTLLSKEVLTDEMVAEIKAEKMVTDQNLRLLTLLKTRPGVFHRFCEVLEDTSHQELAQLLRDAEHQRQQATLTPNVKIQEFFSKHLALNRRLCEEDKRLILSSLATKDELQEEKQGRILKTDENARLNYQVNTLSKKVTTLNEKLDTSLKVNNTNIVEIDLLKAEIKKMQEDVEKRDKELEKLQREKTELEAKIVTNGKTKAVESLEKQLQNQADMVLFKNSQISDLRNILTRKQTELADIQEAFDKHKQDQEEKIQEMSNKLQALTNYTPCNDIPVDNKHLFILNMNIDFIQRKIDTLQKELLEANKTIVSLQSESMTAADILGFATMENSLLECVEKFMNGYKSETDDMKSKIESLKQKLRDAKHEKKSLQTKLDEMKVDKLLMKNNVDIMKRKYLDSRYGSKHSRGSSANSTSMSSSSGLGPLPNITKEVQRLVDYGRSQSRIKKTKSEPNFVDPAFGSTFPKIVNVSMQNERGTASYATIVRPRSRHLSIDDVSTIGEDENEKKVCVVCHKGYLMFENNDMACHYHAGYYGDNQMGSMTGKRWSCCFKAFEKAEGCFVGQHRCHADQQNANPDTGNRDKNTSKGKQFVPFIASHSQKKKYGHK